MVRKLRSQVKPGLRIAMPARNAIVNPDTVLLETSPVALSQSTLAANSLAGSQASGRNPVDRAAEGVRTADNRIQEQRGLAAVQLSSSGKVKSALAELQTSSTALRNTAQTASSTGIRKLAGSFVKAFNAALETARSANVQAGSALERSAARGAESGLRSSIGDDATLADLRKIGITQQANGTLAIDNQAFADALRTDSDAVRSTLARIGQQVERPAAAQLAGSGNIGDLANTRSQREGSLDNREPDQEALATAARQTVSTQANRFNESLNSGAAAYQRVFSL